MFTRIAKKNFGLLLQVSIWLDIAGKCSYNMHEYAYSSQFAGPVSRAGGRKKDGRARRQSKE